MSRTRGWLAGAALVAALSSCGGTGELNAARGAFAPGMAAGDGADPLETGHRLMEAGEYQLALDAYMRATARDGFTIDTLSAMGSANLRLGRLGQAESMLRRAVALDPSFPAAWNNLGVLLMEQGEYSEASESFRRAFAADSGASDTIRDNLRAALARLDDPDYTGPNEAGEVSLIGFGPESPRAPDLPPGVIEPL